MQNLLYDVAFDLVIRVAQLILIFVVEILPQLLAIACITLIERKVMGSIHRRRGPSWDENGVFGVAQPITDGIKLVLKEIVSISNNDFIIFLLAPLFTLYFTFLVLLNLPISEYFVTVELQYIVLVILIVGSFNVQAITLAGWSSNSKYAFLGGIRAASQMISYEICMGTIVSSVIMMSGSFSLVDIVYSQYDVWFIFPLFPIWVLFVIVSLAETNRSPFDLVEAEAELVAGYHVEYSGGLFAIFFVAEYGNILIMSVVSTLFFFGGWLLPFAQYVDVPGVLGGFFFCVKTSFNVFIFILVRATVPRYRYDQLMGLGWKVLLPISLSLLVLQSALMLLLEIYTA
jgi:NADH-quinone oxidoreductase subunit H